MFLRAFWGLRALTGHNAEFLQLLTVILESQTRHLVKIEHLLPNDIMALMADE